MNKFKVGDTVEVIYDIDEEIAGVSLTIGTKGIVQVVDDIPDVNNLTMGIKFEDCISYGADGLVWLEADGSVYEFPVIIKNITKSDSSGWISVDDKLPDLDGITPYSTSDMMLVCTETKFVSIGYLRVESDTNGDTYTYWLNSNDERFESKVTHWMEKPQPPVGDK